MGRKRRDKWKIDKEKEWLHNPISAASKVEHLEIIFYHSGLNDPENIRDAFQSKRWCFLQKLSVGWFKTTSEIWLALLRRHAYTLRHLEFHSIELAWRLWAAILEGMQQVLALESACVREHLTVCESRRWYELDPNHGVSWDDMCSQENRIRKAIEDFLVNGGGDCPLWDEQAHPSQ